MLGLRASTGATLAWTVTVAAAIGFILDLEHVGWACAAALLVMRPSADMQRLRSAGRILAVAIGALAGARRSLRANAAYSRCGSWRSPGAPMRRVAAR